MCEVLKEGIVVLHTYVHDYVYIDVCIYVCKKVKKEKIMYSKKYYYKMYKVYLLCYLMPCSIYIYRLHNIIYVVVSWLGVPQQITGPNDY